MTRKKEVHSEDVQEKTERESVVSIATRALSEKVLCDHCLGRLFAHLLSGYTNDERGRAIRTVLAMMHDNNEPLDILPENLAGTGIRKREVPEERGECQVCGDVFENLEEIANKIVRELEDYEYETFLVGIRLSREQKQREKEFEKETGLRFPEELKSELSREIGKLVEKATGKKADRRMPDIAAIYDFGTDYVELEVRSLFIAGKYKKLERGLPQSKWPCRKCRGLGCEECDWTGKQYPESVEELIAEPIVREADGLGSKFHGAGREDVDALCLAGRPFVLEILSPRKRSLPIKELEKEINEKNKGRVEVEDLVIADRELVEKIKRDRSDKKYRAIVELEREVSKEDLEKAEKELSGIVIEQRTPTRVSHRRADLVRKRKVYEFRITRVIDPQTIEIEVTAEAGTYIKELVSGDNGRTQPSLSSVLGVQARVRELDIIGFYKKGSIEYNENRAPEE